jgi:hypothetical protein
MDISPERRRMLAIKGQRLYHKDCRTDGTAICALSFVGHHIGRGESVVVEDFLAFLREQVEFLSQQPESTDTRHRLKLTMKLIERVEEQL